MLDHVHLRECQKKMSNHGRQFSLRALLISVVAIAMTLAVVHFAREPRPIVKKIEARGGTIELSSGGRAFAGLRRFEVIDRVEVNSDDIDDDDMMAISRIKSVSDVVVGSQNISDRGVLALRGLPLLLVLRVRSPEVSDQGMRVAGELNSKYVSVSSPQITGEFLEQFPAEPRLYTLEIHSASFDDDGMRRIARMRRLAYVDVSECPVTDEGLLLLSEMERLDFLRISNTKVTREGLDTFRSRRPDVQVVATHLSQ